MDAKFKETLDTIANFIGTHGLAVFLVIFYALVIYPQSQEERSEWIQEITKVRMFVDPNTKPLNTLQADAVSRIVIDQYVGSLQQIYFNNQINRISDDAINPYFFPQEGETTRPFSLFGEVFEFDLSDDKEVAFKKFDTVFSYAKRSLIESRQELSNEAERVLTIAKQTTQSTNIQLERLSLENGNMKEIWVQAVSATDKDWNEYFHNRVPDKHFYSIKSFLSRIKQIPHYYEWSAANQETINAVSSIENVDTFALTTFIKSRLENEVSKGIKSSILKAKP